MQLHQDRSDETSNRPRLLLGGLLPRLVGLSGSKRSLTIRVLLPNLMADWSIHVTFSVNRPVRFIGEESVAAEHQELIDSSTWSVDPIYRINCAQVKSSTHTVMSQQGDFIC